MPNYRILLADDQDVVLEGLASVLSKTEAYEIVGLAHNAEEAVSMAKRLQPDIVIMDFAWPEIDGVETVKKIKDDNPATRLVIYTANIDRDQVLELFKIGVSAYVLKDGPMSDLILALKSVESGATYFSSIVNSALTSQLMSEESQGQSASELLSPREMQIYKLLADGRAIKEIAIDLDISHRTVESHKYKIMKKLGADGMADLTKSALKNKLIKY